MPACSRSSRPGSSPGGRARRRARRRVAAVDQQAVDARRAPTRRSRPCARPAPARVRPGTRPPSAARSPTTATGSRRRRPRQQLRQPVVRERAASSTTPRASSARRCSANAPGTSPWMRTAIVGRRAAAPPRPAAAAPCAGRRSRRNRPSAARRPRPGRAVAAQRLPDLLVLRHRLADDVDHLLRVAGADQRPLAPPRRPPGRRSTPRAKRARISRQPLAVAGGVAARRRRRRSGAAVAGPVAQIELLVVQVGARAGQPVVVGREVARGCRARRPRRSAPRRGCAGCGSARRRAGAVERLGEGAGDRRVVDLAPRVAQVEQAVRAVEHADQPHAVLVPRAHLVRLGSSVRPTAAWKTVTSQPRRASSLATSRGTIVPPPESL